MRIAVVGAGITGLTCARILTDAGAQVVVLEKARGVGGRLSTRRTDHGSFDHGAGVLRPQDVLDVPGAELAPFAPRLAGAKAPALLVPVPGASALPKALAEGLDVRPTSHVAPLASDGLLLRSLDGTELGTFDRAVVTAPPAQVAELLAQRAPVLAARAAAARMLPCWTAMVAPTGPLQLPFDAVFDREPIRWAVAETAKPGRGGTQRWTIQATAAFSEQHLEDPPEQVAAALLSALERVVRDEGGGPASGEPVLLQAHRWRYARVGEPLPEPFLHDVASGVLAGGDWCTPADGAVTPGTVAAAQIAGAALAAALLVTG